MNIEQFFIDQLAVWPEVKQRYEDLKAAQHKVVSYIDFYIDFRKILRSKVTPSIVRCNHDLRIDFKKDFKINKKIGQQI